jgi:hypothetical protein
MKKRALSVINLATIVAMVLMAVSPLTAFAAPQADRAQSSPVTAPLPEKGVTQDQPQPLIPIVSPAVTPHDTAGQAPAPTVTGASVGEDLALEYDRLIPRTYTAAQPQADGALQTEMGPNAMPGALLNFEGVNNVDGVHPPDPNGEVGKDHYVQMVNLSMAVYSKTTGSLLYGPFHPNDLWPQSDICRLRNDGDPVVLYDQAADRWLVSQFALPSYPYGPFYECIGVSKTGTPTNNPNDWYLYTFLVHSNKMDDYPKLSVWPDAYYMSVNQFTTNGWGGAGVFAFDRNKMMLGQAATFQYFDLYNVNPVFGGMLPVDWDGPTAPPAGTPGYFIEMDDDLAGAPDDQLSIWKFHVDWTTPANSTFGLNGLPNHVVPVADFALPPCTYSGSRGCVPQKGTTARLDSLGDRLMFRAAWRQFEGYDSLVVNHTVYADSIDRLGVRWYEVRNLFSNPTVYQQSTYAPNDGVYRWMGSAAMDHVGNLAIGYSASSSTMYPAVRYAGRLANDPLNTLAQGEASLIEGTGSQTSGYARWGDYSDLTVDPIDDCTFWYTNEYLAVTDYAPWRTRIGSFRFPTCSTSPRGTLAGTVTDATTTNPIGDVAITAAADSEPAGTATNGSGQYSLLLPTGNYTVTAYKYGYNPGLVSGAVVTQFVTTTVDFALTPAAMYIVTGTVRDSATGWPLYGSIGIDGYPGAAIWTNPATGFYSITLAGGIPYVFHITAFSAGYQPVTQNVGMLTNDSTINLTLNADLTSCAAPGYAYTGVGLSQNFDSVIPPALPALWSTTVITSGTSNPWITFVGTRYPGNNTAHSGAVNALFKGRELNTNVASARLQYATPITMNQVVSPALSFWMFHDQNGPTQQDRIQVQVSTNYGASWQNLGDPVYRYGPNDRWQQHTFDLTPYAQGNSVILVGLQGISAGVAQGSAWDMHVDDVQVGTLTCTPQTGGLIVGQVRDANTNQSLPGVTVNSGLITVTAQATPLDPTVSDALYTLFAPAGARNVTASTYRYTTTTQSTTVITSDVVTLDFALPAGRFLYTPSAITTTVDAGQIITVPALLTNTGSVTATYQFYKLDKGVVPYGPIEHSPYTVKPFRQDAREADPRLPVPPSYPQFFMSTVRSWSAPGVQNAWGLAYNANRDSVWVSSPAFGWGGVGQFYEAAPLNGTLTGVTQPYSWEPIYGPADATYNWNTGKLWVMNVDDDPAKNCIYEIDPASGYTGQRICVGAGGWDYSQRGLAYDPTTDTYFAGSWNDGMIYRFKPDGTVLAAKYTGLWTAGLAYNPDTGHLLVVEAIGNGSKFYKIDVNNDYAVIGEATVTGFINGAGLEIDCSGNFWALDQASNTVFQLRDSTETTTICNRSLPWLNPTPITGIVPGNTVRPISVVLNATNLQPGVYDAQLAISHTTPYVYTPQPVHLTVSIPATWGKVTGNVSTPGYCSSNPAGLSGMTVTVKSSIGTYTTTTDVNGNYQWWADSNNNPYTVTVSGPNYEVGQATGVTLVPQATIGQDFSLQLLKPCLNVSPSSIPPVTLNLGATASRQINLSNAGAASGAYTLTDKSLGVDYNPPGATQPATYTLSFGDESYNAFHNIGGAFGQGIWLNRFTPDPAQYPFVLDRVETQYSSFDGPASVYEIVIYEDVDGDGNFLNATLLYTQTISPYNIGGWNTYTLTKPVQFTRPGDVLIGQIKRSSVAGFPVVYNTTNPQNRSWGVDFPGFVVPNPPTLNTASTTFWAPGNYLIRGFGHTARDWDVDAVWLTETPATGVISPSAFVNASVQFNANAVAAPGTYRALVNVNSDDPFNPLRTVSVTLNVNALGTWGVLTGTIRTTGYCDNTPGGVSSAPVVLENKFGVTRTVNTLGSGAYSLWLDSLGNPYTLTVSAPGYTSGSLTNLNVPSSGGTTGSVDVTLRSIQPCLLSSVSNLSAVVPWNSIVTQTFTLSNTGAATTPYTITEFAGGVEPLLPAVKDIAIIRGGTTAGDGEAIASFTAALTNLGYTYDIIDLGAFASNPLQTLRYKAAVWTGVPSALDQVPLALNALKQYLDAGGRLLVTDDNWGIGSTNNIVANSDFYRTYLDAVPIIEFGAGTSPAAQFPVSGVDIMAGINTVVTRGSPDAVVISGTHAVGVFTSTRQANAFFGLRIARQNYRVVYLTSKLSFYGTNFPGTPDPIETPIMQNALNWLLEDVAWLNETPVTGTLAADGGAQEVTVEFNSGATGITQPGTYYANLRVASEDAYNVGARTIPVQMTVTPSATLGKLDGAITGLGYCDVNPAPLNRAVVAIDDGASDVASLFSDVNGYYQYWLNEGTYTVTASYDGHLDNTAVLTINAGLTTTTPIDLRWAKPCVSTTPNSLSANLEMGVSTTLPLTFANIGAGSASWFVREQDRGFEPLASTAGPDIAVVNGDNNSTANANHIQAITRTLENLGYALNSGYIITGAWYMTGTIANLNNYKYVIFVGLPFGNTTPGTVIPDVLMSYLDNGGSLLVSDNNFARILSQYPALPYLARLADYLQIRYVSDTGSRGPAVGQDIMASVNPNLNPDTSADSVEISGTLGVGIFQNPDPRSGWAGTRVARNGYRAMYLGWDFNLTDSNSPLNTVTRTQILQRALNWLTPDDVDWLSEDVIGGSLPPDNGSQPIAVTIDASAPSVKQPGTYLAALNFASDDPVKPNVIVPVTLTVSAPAGWGQIAGRVQGLAACDVSPAPQPNSSLLVESSTGMTWTLKPDTLGNYQLWLDAASSPLTLTASIGAGYLPQTQIVNVNAGQTTSTDLNLRSIAPCQHISSTSLSNTQQADQVVTQTLTISNSGAASLTWNVNTASAPAIWQAGSVVLDGSFETTLAGTHGNLYWPQTSMQNPYLLCNTADCGNTLGGPRSGNYWAWFRSSNGGDQATLAQTLVITPVGTATLSFWMWVGQAAVAPGDYLRVYLDTTQIYTANISTATAGYVKVNVDVSAYADGVTARNLKFAARFAGPALISIDDVALDTGLPTPPACQAGAVPWINLNPIAGSISADSSANVEVGFNSAGLTPGTYTGNVCLRSNDAVNPFTLIPVSLTVVQYGVAASPATDAQSGDPGTDVVYTLHVMNTGTTADTFNVGVMGHTWTTSAPSIVGPLAGGASASVNVTVTVPANAAGGDDDVAAITFTSQGDNSKTAAATLATTANNVFGLSLTPATAAKIDYVGKTAVYTLTLINNSNVSGVFSLSATGQAWNVTLPPTLTLNVGASQAFVVQVTIPLTATHLATDTITITATAQADATATDSSMLTTTAKKYLAHLPLIFR